jgi:hypothetical protein
MRGFGITGVDFAIEAHMDKVAEAVGMNPIELRILNAYRDGDMKAHRRIAKNCALIECCQVVAEKAGVKLSPAMLAAASTRDGGGERARLPAHTATDEKGRVQGFQASSYAKKGGRPPPPPGAPSLPYGADSAASRPMPTARNVPSPPTAQQPGSGSTTPTPRDTAPATPRAGAIRFSSLSGFRRR